MDKNKAIDLAKEALEEASRDFYYIHRHPEDAHTDSYKFMGKTDFALATLLEESEPKPEPKKKTVFRHGQREFGGDASTAHEIDCQESEPIKTGVAVPSDFVTECQKWAAENLVNLDNLSDDALLSLVGELGNWIRKSFAVIDRQAAEIKEHRWIPVDERLPENTKHVIIICKLLGINEGFYTGKEWRLNMNYTIGNQGDVTHWQPIILPGAGDIKTANS